MSFRLFGVSEFSLIAPNLVLYFSLIILTWYFLCRIFDQKVAFLVVSDDLYRSGISNICIGGIY